MRKIWRKLFTTAVLIFMLCLAGLGMSGTAFAQQCVDNGDGTVTDNGTGLMWQKATADLMNWDTAMSYAPSLFLGGHSGWRLPGKDELLGLYHSPCKSLMEFDSVLSDSYWSSTTDENNWSLAWRVHFYRGPAYSANKSFYCRVRAVRSAQ